MRLFWSALLLLGAMVAPAQAMPMDGSRMGLGWAVPFLGLMACLALLPVLRPGLWQRHIGKIAAFWALCVLVAQARIFGLDAMGTTLAHVVLDQALPLMALVTALYVIGGGIRLEGAWTGRPGTNTAMLAVGTLLAAVAGGLVAALLLIGPLLRANAHRRHRMHMVVALIFLVANIGGALSPLGQPAMYMGLVSGVPFLWPIEHLWGPVLLCAGVLLLAFYCLDSWLLAKEGASAAPADAGSGLRLRGWANLPLLGLVVGVVLLQDLWEPGAIPVMGHTLGAERPAAVALLALITGVSLLVTPAGLREAGGFAWAVPFEMGKLFTALFFCIAPLLAMIAAGTEGPFGAVMALFQETGGSQVPALYFWIGGAVSSVVDGAGAYLLALELAGGDAAALAAQDARRLAALTAGVVFMGAATYMGNAANFMLMATAETQGVRMPSFLGYAVLSTLVLVPLLIICALLFFL